MFKKLTITYRFENEPDDLTTQATLTNEDPYTDGDYKLTYYEPVKGRYITTHYGQDLPTPEDMADDALYEITHGGRRCEYVEIEDTPAWAAW